MRPRRLRVRGFSSFASLRAAPPASDPNPWPDATAIRTIVADWWKGHTAEITVVRA